MLQEKFGGLLYFILCLLFYVPNWLLSVLVNFAIFIRLAIQRKEKERLFANVHRIFALPKHSPFAQDFLKQVFRQQAYALFESLQEIIFPGTVQIEGAKELQENMASLENSKGQIVITAHLGSWELVGYYCAKFSKCTFNALAKSSRYTWFNVFMGKMRARMGVQVLWAEKKSTQRAMLTALKNGNWLGFVMDQKPKGRVGPLVNFFKIPTEFVGGPAAVVAKGVPCLSVFCLRVGPRKFLIRSRILFPLGHEETNVQIITQKMAIEIEEEIRLYPEQWCWEYKRWR